MHPSNYVTLCILRHKSVCGSKWKSRDSPKYNVHVTLVSGILRHSYLDTPRLSLDVQLVPYTHSVLSIPVTRTLPDYSWMYAQCMSGKLDIQG